MIGAFVKSVEQLGDPRVRDPIMLSLALTVAIYLLLVAGLWFGLGAVDVVDPPWLDTVIDVAGGLAAFVVALVFFPAVVTAFVGLFLERVAEAVERRHYPKLPAAREVPIGESIAGALSFALVAVGLNVLALPLYIFLPAFNLAIYLLLNGYLLGREYHELVAARRLDRSRLTGERRQHRWRIMLAGVVVAGLMLVPVANLLAPVVATAFMVHIVQALRGDPGSA
ncbi:EI24 domain-containing protein [uncultured Rhodospira sp.]|uniref:EI24 domain-containing protein n=1 Tax=uncultured Rhodospira sp. TaxID=1936189 RepID=UPI00262079B3|nr:EI24 domain-containing protein [uncultured Rhodospira sp.]